MQKKKGISLIVLVITIIVMVVLAGAIILTLNNTGIIGKANKAVDDNNIIAIKTEADLKHAQYITNPSIAGDKDLETWLNDVIDYDGYYVKMHNEQACVIKEGTLVDKYYKGEVKIGDYIAYDAGDNSITLNQYVGEWLKNNMTAEQVTITSASSMKWRVLGAEGDKLKLVSENIVNPNGKNGFSLYGAYSYLKGVEILNSACSVFGKGQYAISARSITADDIDKITGFDKTTYKSNMASFIGTVIPDVPYGTIVNYNGKMHTINGVQCRYGILPQPDITAENNNYVREQQRIVVKTVYKYDMSEGSMASQTEYKLLFKNSDNTQNIKYWLATEMADVQIRYISYGLAMVDGGIKQSNLRTAGDTGFTWDPPGIKECDVDSVKVYSLRPVVILEGNLKVKQINNIWEFI